ncbi:hypothetical protein [Frankia sp. Cppng1_Ct_nod]|uniref:hypothetical protein n=1 Tax=Frankia sp. Cppng1_Ct_nod TaxID=2897162 RepID=UPI0010419212|nr:hypothetical protein [Frankia sp. Cppng1_Ct_nod]
MSILSRSNAAPSEKATDLEPLPRPALWLRERFTGYLSTRVTDHDFQAGWSAGQRSRDHGFFGASEGHEDVPGRSDATSVELVLTIGFDDLEALLRDHGIPGRPSGSVRVPFLSRDELTVVGGEFVLVDPDPDQVETWHVRYRLDLVADDGERYVLDGFKTLHDRPGFDAWSDTTTLYLTLRTAGGQVLGAGIARVERRDFLRALRAVEVRGVADPGRRRRYELAVAKLFAGYLLRIYGGPLDEARRFPAAPGRSPASPPRRQLRLPAPEIRWCGAGSHWHEGSDVGADGWLRLIRYQGGTRGPVLLASGFGMSTGAFLADTIRTNLTEFLVEHGYDVWLFDYRASIDLPSSASQFTLDVIATEDWPTAVAEVRRVTGAADVQAYGHCVGSGSLLMALATGRLPDVRSAVCAQFPLHPVTSPLNRFKTELHVGEALGDLGLKLVRPGRFTLPNVAVDLALRALPMAGPERCGQALCRWINGIYGCTHRHARLNQATHEALNDMFGVGNVTALRHLALMMRGSLVVDDAGRDVYTRNPEFLRLPIRFLQGTDNYIFLPDGSERTMHWLREANGPDLYSRSLLPGYAHLDAIIGRDADRDVYPLITGHFESDGAA